MRNITIAKAKEITNAYVDVLTTRSVAQILTKVLQSEHLRKDELEDFFDNSRDLSEKDKKELISFLKSWAQKKQDELKSIAI